MQMRIHVTNGSDVLLSAAKEISALLESKGLQVASIQVLAPLTAMEGIVPQVNVQNPAPESASTSSVKVDSIPEPVAAAPVQSSAEPSVSSNPSQELSLEQQLEAKYGSEEPLYVPFNAGSSKKIDGKLLSEYTMGELAKKGEIPIVATVREKLLKFIAAGEVDEHRPYEARLYWTEKALIAAGALKEYSFSVFM
jgi:hypothetical protein